MDNVKIDKREFVKIMAFLSAGCGKAASKEVIAVYYDLLCDLPVEVLQNAARAVLIEHIYATLPPVALIRQIAINSMAKPEDKMLPIEAWGLVRWCVSRFGWSGGHKAMPHLPPLVRQVVNCLGWDALCGSTEFEVNRIHFMRAFESMASRNKNVLLLPPPSDNGFASIGLQNLQKVLE